MSQFASDTAVRPAGQPGHLDAEIHPDWFVADGPNGGYVGAIVTRAIAATFDTTERPLRSITIHYLRAPAPGPATVAVEALREGRSVTFATATLSQDGQPFATAQAVLARDGESLELHTPTTLPPLPEADPEPEPIAGLPPFAQRFRHAFTETPGPGEAVSGGWLALRDDEPFDEPLVVALTDSWIPALYAFAGTVFPVPTLDLTVHIRAPLPRPAGWAFVRVTTREAARGFMEEDAVVVAEDGTLLAQSRQLALIR